jgi:hypothetical protein
MMADNSPSLRLRTDGEDDSLIAIDWEIEAQSLVTLPCHTSLASKYFLAPKDGCARLARPAFSVKRSFIYLLGFFTWRLARDSSAAIAASAVA